MTSDLESLPLAAAAKAGYEARVGRYADQQPWDSLTDHGREVETEHYAAAVVAYIAIQRGGE
jgi:hypothetical protein